MENERSLFSLEVDSIAKNHLADTAKWARFLAIVGFASLGILLIFSIVAIIGVMNKTTHDPFGEPVDSTSEITGTIIGSLMIVALYFFPCFFLMKFANKMKRAIETDDGASLNEALKNLKVTFRYAGILTIIFIVLFLLGMLAGLSGG